MHVTLKYVRPVARSIWMITMHMMNYKITNANAGHRDDVVRLQKHQHDYLCTEFHAITVAIANAPFLFPFLLLNKRLTFHSSDLLIDVCSRPRIPLFSYHACLAH